MDNLFRAIVANLKEMVLCLPGNGGSRPPIRPGRSGSKTINWLRAGPDPIGLRTPRRIRQTTFQTRP